MEEHSIFDLINTLQVLKARLPPGARVILNVTEFVVLGGESAGKSSLIEGLAGFQFNFIRLGMGTRCPLIVQMINDQTCLQPRCKITIDGITWDIPVADVADAVSEKTEQLKAANAVSADPIILQLTSRECFNFTLIDTPGLKGIGHDDKKLVADIERMVESLITGENSHRTIICVEQSENTWDHPGLGRLMVNRVDPNYQRTIFVKTKIDQILLRQNADAPEWFEDGRKKIPNCPMFCVSTPTKPKEPQKWTDEEFRAELQQETHKTLNIVNNLNLAPNLNIGFGVEELKKYLEDDYAKKLKAHMGDVLSSIDKIVHNLGKQLDETTAALQKNDDKNLQKDVVRHAAVITNMLQEFFQGKLNRNIEDGVNLKDENNRCFRGMDPTSLIPWMHQVDFSLLHTQYSLLYGGSQYNRILNEIELIVKYLELPYLGIDQVDIARGAQLKANNASFGDTVSELCCNQLSHCVRDIHVYLAKKLKFFTETLLTVTLNYLQEANKDSLAFSLAADQIRQLYPAAVESVLNKWQDLAKDVVPTEEYSRSMLNPLTYRKRVEYSENVDTKTRVKEELQNVPLKETPQFANLPTSEIIEPLTAACRYAFRRLCDQYLTTLLGLTNSFFSIPLQKAIPAILGDIELPPNAIAEVMAERQRLENNKHKLSNEISELKELAEQFEVYRRQ